MYCPVYDIGGVTAQTCKNAILDKVQGCVLCDGVAREPYPDPMPECGCSLPINHPGTCDHRRSFFDPYREPADEEKRFIAGLLRGKAPGRALTDAGITAMNPEQKARRLMNQPHIRARLGEILDRKGATDEKVAKVVAEGLDATDVQIRMEKRTEDGRAVEKAVAIDRPDWNARARFVELLWRAKGYFDKGDGDRGPARVTVINRHSRKGADGEQEDSGFSVEVG